MARRIVTRAVSWQLRFPSLSGVGWNSASRDSIFTNAIGWTDSVVTWLEPANKRYRRYYHHTAVMQLDSVGIQTTSGITFANRHYYWDASTGALDSLGAAGSVTRLGYTPEFLDSTITWPGSVVETHTHTSTHLLASTAFSVSAVDAALSRTYGYADSLGHLSEVGRKTAGFGEVRQFVYTKAGQLGAYYVDSLTQANACTPPTGTELRDDGQVCQSFTNYNLIRNIGYAYDSAGNLTQRRDSLLGTSTTGSYGAGDRLSAWGGVTYTMDHDGNDSTRTSGGVTTTLGWTADNRLSSVTAGTVTLSYGYNAFGQLVQRSRKIGTESPVLERQFVWDQGQLLAELDGSGTSRIGEYAYWPGVDAPYALVTGAQAIGATRYFVQDASGNVEGVFTSAGSAQNLLYRPFGVLDSVYTQFGAVADTNRLRWKGLVWEGDSTRLYYVRNRWYDPVGRRFVSEDPIGLAGGINPYVFAGNDPVNGGDPSGLGDDPEMLAGVTVIGCPDCYASIFFGADPVLAADAPELSIKAISAGGGGGSAANAKPH